MASEQHPGGNTHDVRDGVPTADEIRQVARLLQIPLDEAGIGFDNMTPERQVTCLLAILAAWITAYQFFHDTHTDRLTPAEMQALISSAQTEVSHGNPPADMNAALWHIQTAGFINTELGRACPNNPNNPATAIGHLLLAAARILTSWRDTTDLDGFELDGVRYTPADGTHVKHARKNTVDALTAINKLLGPSASRN